MFLCTFFKNQSFDLYESFITREDIFPLVLSEVEIAVSHKRFVNSNFPPIDSRYQVIKDFLNQDRTDEEVFIVDWEAIVLSGSSIAQELLKCVETNFDVKISQEQSRIQDCRLAPYMENMIMIADHLKLDSDRLFKYNPKLLTSKLIYGQKANIIKLCDFIMEKRYQLGASSLAASPVIINSYVSALQ